VTICHRTNSRTNPYNQIVVTQESAINGHAAHRGPIFAPGVDEWGDIIAPIRPGLPRGRNWPEGRAILEEGCEVQPDVGPEPRASEGEVECDGTGARMDITLLDEPRATAPATFEIVVNGTVVETVGPLQPGETETITLTGDLDALEDQTFTVQVTSGGQVLASRVVTVDCQAGPPQVDLAAQLECAGQVARGTLTATNNGPDPVEVTLAVDGVPTGTAVVVGPGATESGVVDLGQYEDQTITVTVLLDGVVAGTYTVTPNCIPPDATPRASVAGLECPPPTATVTLANTGDPDSRVVFVIRIDGRIVQVSAPLYGGDATTIVGDLSQYEDQTVDIELRANGQVLGSRTIAVDCRQPVPPGPGDGPPQPVVVTPPALPDVGADIDPGVLAIGIGLVALGALLVLVASRGPRTTASRATRR
jgi:hypothetical protein